VIRVSNSIGLGKSKVVWDILSHHISPGLRGIDLSPHVESAVVHSLVGGNPVVGTGAETLSLVAVLFPTKIAQPVREKIVGLGGQAANIPGWLVRGAEHNKAI
jgi:hypothetical protein